MLLLLKRSSQRYSKIAWSKMHKSLRKLNLLLCRECVLEINAMPAAWTRAHTPQFSHVASHCRIERTNQLSPCSKEKESSSWEIRHSIFVVFVPEAGHNSYTNLLSSCRFQNIHTEKKIIFMFFMTLYRVFQFSTW